MEAAILSFVLETWEGYLSAYEFNKYPPDEYKYLKEAFGDDGKNVQGTDVRRALAWKFGHYGKTNYPQHQKDLADEIFARWGDFTRQQFDGADKVFEYWDSELGKKRRFITKAFLTHLICPDDVPIIDQHNFRAMNHLLSLERKAERGQVNKPPSTWADIEALRTFEEGLLPSIAGASIESLDKYLMMMGKAKKKRSKRGNPTDPDCERPLWVKSGCNPCSASMSASASLAEILLVFRDGPALVNPSDWLPTL